MKLRYIISFFFICLNLINIQSNYVIALSNNPQKKEEKSNLINEDYYILGHGDVLRLNIFGAPELSGEIKIINDGTVSIPIAGNIKISGLTLDQATLKIKKLLSKELLQSDLQILLLKTRPVKVAIIGEVARPGIYSLTDKEVSQIENASKVSISGLPTVVDAIQKAGGLSKKADLTNIELYRKLSGENGKYKKANLNFLQLIKSGDFNQNPFLFDSDVIKIKSISSGNTSKNGITISKSNLSPKTITINVVGEVKNPGEFKVKNNTSLIRGILAAGGPLDIGSNKGKVKLLRIEDDGTHSVSNFRYDLRKPTSERNNPMLIAGDTLIVNSSLFGKTTKTIKAVSQPVSGIVQIWTLLRLIQE